MTPCWPSSQVDHDGPRGAAHILFGTEQDLSDGDFVFIDHEKALFLGEIAEAPVKEAPFPIELRTAMDRGEITTAVYDLENLGDNVVEEVVARIPEDFMPEAERDRIIGRLLARKPQVRAALDRYLEGE